MKPKLTANGTELINQVQSELTARFSDQCVLLFAVRPALGIGHCSVQFIESETPFLITREWKPEREDNYPLGIHDLNNIYIAERRIALSTEDCKFIHEIKNLDLTIEKSNGIMLDGANYLLELEEKTIGWTLIDGISAELENALKQLTDLAGISHRNRIWD